ncbi:MAG: GlsB/YeaQ/YmgE family stress response membrane protein [Candidatus Eisenbacteria bacterium]|nr:GlsB/YeaQ/YmgE family stress response membrane protein [Candidatus Eisenbacteria bacterium]
MGLLSWIIFGALAGWVAGLIMGARQGCCLTVIVGIVGAFIGGLIMELVTGTGFSFAFNLRSFLVAVVGSIVLLAIVLGATGRRRP